MTGDQSVSEIAKFAVVASVAATLGVAPSTLTLDVELLLNEHHGALITADLLARIVDEAVEMLQRTASP